MSSRRSSEKYGKWGARGEGKPELRKKAKGEENLTYSYWGKERSTLSLTAPMGEAPYRMGSGEPRWGEGGWRGGKSPLTFWGRRFSAQ